MKFSEVVAQTLAWLQREGRVSYRALKREFDLNDEYIEDLKAEIVKAKRLAIDEEGAVLVWTGAAPVPSPNSQVLLQPPTLNTQSLSAERRQLTVMFCDLVGSTALSARLDPEDLRAVVRAYQQTCAEVIQRHEGYLAQYLGDGILVYFGYPVAHEDDARRAVRTGLAIVTTLQKQAPSPLVGEGQGEGAAGKERKLQVRIGIHTGLVVIGEIGASGRTEHLALGETPNIAARVQGLAEPNTVLVSAATQQIIDGQFECPPFGSHLLKGIDTPIAVYHVQSERQIASPLAGRVTLTPLVGREQEVGLLFDRWEQVKEGRGQVVLLSGEPGIGKSRLAYTLREHVTSEGSLLFEARCSPYHQHSALYPLIEVLQRTLLLTHQDTEVEQFEKLERALALYGMQESFPLFTALLSLPTLPQCPPLNLTPQKQKERTLQALVQLLVAQAERQATVSVWEDLHWADPSSLEFLSLLIDQIPTTKLFLVLTFRPEFTPLWKLRSHINQLTLNRLGKKQIEAMIEKVSGPEAMSAEVLQQIVAKTDGVPLFVEELTKSVVEAVGAHSRAPLQTLAIPATLQEALLARLDRLSTARQIAQLGATLGREFSYELLHAVAPISETDLQTSLTKLVEAEILYQRGVGEQTRYFFKHALIQDTAYHSLLKSTRQQYHQQIALVLEERFSDIKETQPELLAHHYTEAGLTEQSIPYWQRAGERASQRFAFVEAVSHFTKGLTLLKTQPDTLDRAQQELALQIALGGSLMATKGGGALEVGATYTRARELCQRMGETPQLFSVLSGLRVFHLVRGEYQTARKLGEQMVRIAQSVQDPVFLLEAHYALGITFLFLGEFALARTHFEQGITLDDSQSQRPYPSVSGQDHGVACRASEGYVLWLLGYPDQALKRSDEALTLTQGLVHPHSRGLALVGADTVHNFRREGQVAQELAETGISLATEHGLPFFLTAGFIHRGWALAQQGQTEEGIAQIHKGLTASRATGTEAYRASYLGCLTEAYRVANKPEEGLPTLAEALAVVERAGERWWEAELYRFRGELTLQQENQKAKIETDPRPDPDPQGEAEACFLKAIEIARKQAAKSWELRASTSLARLWQQQGKKAEAHKLLSDVYNWFTEGFDTKDLQEAKALLESLESGG